MTLLSAKANDVFFYQILPGQNTLSEADDYGYRAKTFTFYLFRARISG